MAAYNWIVFSHECPVCGTESILRAQCHVASSFDGRGAERFFGFDYQIGEVMRWWKREDPDWEDWADEDERITSSPVDAAHECCYTECTSCGADLYAVIEFVDLTPQAPIDVGREEDWPSGFLK